MNVFRVKVKSAKMGKNSESRIQNPEEKKREEEKYREYLTAEDFTDYLARPSAATKIIGSHPINSHNVKFLKSRIKNKELQDSITEKVGENRWYGQAEMGYNAEEKSEEYKI